MKSKSLEERLNDVRKERKILLNNKTLLLEQNRNILDEGKQIRQALQESLVKLGFRKYQRN